MMYPRSLDDMFPFSLIKDIYWCFIPLKCRYCKWLSQCRKPFLQGRKCYNGCVELNILREQDRQAAREDYINSLLEYVDDIEKQRNKRNRNQ